MPPILFTPNRHPTLGIELELGLVDLQTYDLTSAFNQLIERLPDRGANRFKPEIIQSVIEINTDVCQSIGEAEKDLRGRLGFDGLICSDDLEMAGAHSAGDVVARADAAIDAGCDVVLLCNDFAAMDDLLGRFGPPPQPHLARRLERMQGR